MVRGVDARRGGVGLIFFLLGFAMPRSVRVETILAWRARPVRRFRVSRRKIDFGFKVVILDPGSMVRKPFVAGACKTRDAGRGWLVGYREF